MKPVLVYYLVGPVHPKHLAILARALPPWAFRAAQEPAPGAMDCRDPLEGALERVILAGGRVPDAVWEGDVRALLFSAVQPRPVPIRLLAEARRRGIPAIAIEETNQLALTDGTNNNYLLPVDRIFAASGAERALMIEAGTAEDRIEVTGWPFFAGERVRPLPERQREMKGSLGLDPDRPVALLALTAIYDSREHPESRRRLLRLAAEGLPEAYQLVVKPHPVEPLEAVRPFVAAAAPRAAVVDGRVPIEAVLEVADVLLNCGTSQVCIEALWREIPLLVLETGIRTPFHACAPSVIVREPGEVEPLLRRFSGGGSRGLYARFASAHMPCAPSEALQRVARRIEEIAARGAGAAAEGDAGRFDLTLYQAWRGDRREALRDARESAGPDGAAAWRPLERLIRRSASRADLDTLRRACGSGFRSHILRCLWIEQLARRRDRPTGEDLAWMRDFPPLVNAAYFAESADRWMHALLEAGERRAAEELTERLERGFTHVPAMAEIAGRMRLYEAGWAGRWRYAVRRATGKVRRARTVVGRRLRAAGGSALQ
jgi:hypothetical protein